MEDTMDILEHKQRYGQADAKLFVATCPECQRSGNISQRNAMPPNYNLQVDLFDVWGIDFMGPFVNSNGYEHILIVVDYV
jgi:hypothetical protein